MSAVVIKPVRTRRERMAFITLAWQFYRDDPHWVPPLIADMRTFINPDKGVFFESGEARLFIAYRDERPVGRISAQVSHRHQELYGDGKGFFGFFECEDNQQTAQLLFAAAERYLTEEGCRSAEGPLNFTIYDEIGVLVDGFDAMPYVLNVHNPPYYQRLIEGAGYGKAVDWYAFRTRSTQADGWSPRLRRLRDRIEKRPGVRIRNMERRHFQRDATIVKNIFNAAWDRNWGHVPMSDEEFARISTAVKQLIIPELSFVAEVNDKPVGFALSVYDANPAVKAIDGKLFPFGFIKLFRNMKRTDRFRLVLMGVLEEHRGRGYEAAFYINVLEHGLAMGFRECEMSNVVETNEPMLASLQHMPAERYKTYRLFRKDFGASTDETAPITRDQIT